MEDLLKISIFALGIVIAIMYIYEVYYEDKDNDNIQEQFDHIRSEQTVPLARLGMPPYVSKPIPEPIKYDNDINNNLDYKSQEILIKKITPDIKDSNNRNRIRNPKTAHRYDDSGFIKNKNSVGVRDLDDKMPTLKFSPMVNTECNYFGENDMYTKSILQFNDLDNVDRINEFRNTNQKQFVGETVSDIFDKLNGNDLKVPVDLLSKEGTSFSSAGRGFKTIDIDRWHYPRENSINGGKLYGFSGLKGSDPDLLNYAALT